MRAGTDDFTESAYRTLVRRAVSRFTLVPFTDPYREGTTCLWRHDIDCSVQRARRLAEIEREEGARATYFVHLHSEFYNALERRSREDLAAIRAAGHDIGLHFDAAYHGERAGGRTGLDASIRAERAILEDLVSAPVSSLSFHNPGIAPCPDTGSDELAGMVNAYGRTLQARYTYCSDSNGCWRHRSLAEVLDDEEISRLHVLTHPGWWTPGGGTPRERIVRAVAGRARATVRWYEGFLRRAGRAFPGGSLDDVASLAAIAPEAAFRIEELWSTGDRAGALLELGRLYLSLARRSGSPQTGAEADTGRAPAGRVRALCGRILDGHAPPRERIEQDVAEIAAAIREIGTVRAETAADAATRSG